MFCFCLWFFCLCFFLLTNYRLSRYNVLLKMGNMIGDDFGALGYELYHTGTALEKKSLNVRTKDVECKMIIM